MRTEYSCEVLTGKPKVAFRETISRNGAKYVYLYPLVQQSSFWDVKIHRNRMYFRIDECFITKTIDFKKLELLQLL